MKRPGPLKKMLAAAIAAALLFQMPGAGFYQAWAGQSLSQSRIARPAPAAPGFKTILPVSHIPGDVLSGVKKAPLLDLPAALPAAPAGITGPSSPQTESPFQKLKALEVQTAGIRAGGADTPSESTRDQGDRIWTPTAANQSFSIEVPGVPDVSGRPSRLAEAAADGAVQSEPRVPAPRNVPAIWALWPGLQVAAKTALDAVLGLVSRFTWQAVQLLAPKSSIAAALFLASFVPFLPVYALANTLDLEPNAYRVTGGVDFHARYVSPKYPGYEAQLQHNFYEFANLLLQGKPSGVPVAAEFWLTPESDGTPRIHQLYFDPVAKGSIVDSKNWTLRVGIAPIPLGLQNDYAMSEQRTLITEPMQWGTARNQSRVERLNSPGPLLGAGFSSLGVQAILRPDLNLAFNVVLKELTFGVVNGPRAIDARDRAFINPTALNVQGPPPEGVWLDTENNDPHPFTDNNNDKTFVFRGILGIGDKISAGLSGMKGVYDLEGLLTHQVYTAHVIWEPARAWKLTTEAFYAKTGLRVPVADASGAVNLSPESFDQDSQVTKGLATQLDFSILGKFGLGNRLLGAVAHSYISTDAPLFIFSTTPSASTGLPLRAHPQGSGHIITDVNRLSLGLALEVTKSFSLRYAHNLWLLNHIPAVGGVKQSNISDDVISASVRFNSDDLKISLFQKKRGSSPGPAGNP